MDPKDVLWALIVEHRAWFEDQLAWCEAENDPEEHGLLSAILDLTR